MKRTIKLGASFSGKISTGSYENTNPGFYAEEVFELEGDNNVADSVIQSRQSDLHQICYRQFSELEQRLIAERIQKERKEFRFYLTESGEQYPSVTSFLNYDADFFMPEPELQQYASCGNITHARVEEFIKSGKWVDPKEIGDMWTDIVIVKGGNLQLNIDCGDFPSFLKKYPISNMRNGSRGFNHEHRYAGTDDFQGIPEFKDCEKVDTLFDVKRTPEKVKNFMQLASYAKRKGWENIKQLCIIPLNDKTDQGYSKPIVTTEIDNYFKMAMDKRQAFKKRYGI